MDEPTSALDRYTARTVLDTILAFGKDKTLILISHNPAEIAKADRVVLLRDGHVAEEGTPRDLVAQRGYFYELYREELDLFRADNKNKPDTVSALTQKNLQKKARTVSYSQLQKPRDTF